MLDRRIGKRRGVAPVVAILVCATCATCSTTTTAVPSTATTTGLPPPSSAAPAAPARAIDIAFGRSFCVVRSDGRVACWGADGGSLGDGTREARSAPRTVPGLDGIIDIRGLPGHGHCARRFDRSLWCWGFGDENGTARLAPTRVLEDVADYVFAEPKGVTSIYVGGGPGVCARRQNGDVPCVQFTVERKGGACLYWGDERRQNCLEPEFRVRAIPAQLQAADAPLVFGEPDDPRLNRGACALFGHEVRCRGSNDQGQLGNPALSDSATFVPVQGLADVVSLASFPHSSCAVRAGGQVLCWGRNHGELKIPADPRDCVAAGSGGITVPCTRRPTPIPVADVVQVVEGVGGLALLTRAGDVLLGCPLWTEQATRCKPDQFYRAEGLPPLARIQPGRTGLCGLDGAGAVHCYGYGSELGDGAPLIDRAPVQIPGLTGVRAVRVQWAGGACAVLADGGVSCWNVEDAPRGLAGITALGDGCALASDGRVWCWGLNGDGEMGLGRRLRPKLQRPDKTFDPIVSATPLPVPGVRDISALTTDESRRCALDRAGVLRCWGLFVPGKTRALSATTFPDLPLLQGVHIASIEMFALARDGSIWHIGDDYREGRSGGVLATRTELGPASSLPTHGTVSQGKTSNGKPILCWIAPDRSARCSGTPGPIEIAGPVAQLSVSEHRGCALLADGHLSCWGRPYCAENNKSYCRGDVWNRVEPVLDQVTQVSVGDKYTCAVRTGGSVWCWGSADMVVFGNPRLHAPRVSRVDLGAP